jgi:hypothetical protein
VERPLTDLHRGAAAAGTAKNIAAAPGREADGQQDDAIA